ncbi:MAG: GGDEF domain-containing phosphodiesterase [Sedimentibacter sp.]|uniref:putative bifunctional diguanylate cyclase/phosphodiesterase n=1 Tax=Sedimentibacter sp. TaxID=1960295 RepID=UPI00315916AC
MIIVAAIFVFSDNVILIQRDLVLNTFIIIVIALEAGFYFVTRNFIKHMGKYRIGLSNADVSQGTDALFYVRNKLKFIRDSEMLIKENKEKRFALVHYDISKFNIINNSVGYDVGDDILRKICKVFIENLKNEVFGKSDGDNFFVLFEYDKQEELIERMLLISKKIEKLKIWSKINIRPAVKMGVYFIDNNNSDIRVAIDRADFAKSHMQSWYISDYAIYSESIGNSLIEVKKIEDGMHQALERDQFKVFYQPKVSLKTGIMAGAEALVRWDHPELGLLNPVKFIPIFEKDGFIVNLDKYVFEQVCIDIRKWLDLGYDVVPVSVNVSRVHFINSNFVAEYNEIREKYRIPDKLIEIEITESVVFGNECEKDVFSVMKDFREEGFEISMDDFGSGYSSLGLLKEMPIDTLKLDKIFLNQIEEKNSQVIVNNIVDIARNLKLNVVSEGVETDMQLDFLRNIGCDMAQGFIFSKPKPKEEFEKLISSGRKNYYDIIKKIQEERH